MISSNMLDVSLKETFIVVGDNLKLEIGNKSSPSISYHYWLRH